MNHTEEGIVSERLKAQRQKTLRSGVALIDGRSVTFTKMEFEAAFSILVPAGFNAMDKQAVHLKYMSASRPQIVLVDPSDTVNLTFTYFPDEPLKDEDIDDTTEYYRELIRKSRPGNLFYHMKIVRTGKLPTGDFAYRSKALDGDMYNEVFIAPVHGCLLYGSMNCFYAQRDTWEKPFEYMINSIEELKPGRRG